MSASTVTPVGRALERVLPARMGRSFRLLLGSTLASNLGDGIALAAGPLLIASQTRSPALVAAAALLQRAPWLVLGLYAGAIADRLDRRLLVAIVDLLQAGVLVILSVAILTDHLSIALVLVAMLLLGMAEVFSDSAASTLLPMLVDRADLGLGNARLQGAFLTANQLVGPPIGAALFALGAAVPFVTQAVCGALGAVLILRMRVPRLPEPTATGHVRRDIAEGVRWLVRHPGMRTLALVILTFNVTWGAAWSVLVLWSLERLHLGEVGFGLLTTAIAIGGIAATGCFGWLERRTSYEVLMKACLISEVVMHLVLALTTTAWLALLVMVGFGFYAFVWGTVGRTLRQRAVPDAFQGRVGSVYMVGLFGGLVVGQALGGAIAQRWGVVAPFWFAFVGSGLTLVAVWRQLAHVAREE